MHAEPGALTLLQRVCERFSSAGADFCLIGAAAMAVHGVVRATADIDLLTVDLRPLDSDFWGDSFSDKEVDIRRADADDPLGGVVRVADSLSSCVDVVIGRPSWHGDVVANAEAKQVLGLDIPVAGARDLVALKLYAGGPQDAWDVHQLLDAEPDLLGAVDSYLDRLPTDARELWAKIRSERIFFRRS